MSGSDFHGFVEGRGSLVEFKDGRLHCCPANLSLVPVVFLEKFGVQVYPRFSFSDVGKEYPGYNGDLEEKEAESSKAKKNNLFSSQPQNIAHWP
jgi:hypothetical protein